MSTLKELRAAFDRGDYRAVREGEKALRASDASEETKAKARALVSRTEAPPHAKWLFILLTALLLTLALYWQRESARPHPAPTMPTSSAKRPVPPSSPAPAMEK